MREENDREKYSEANKVIKRVVAKESVFSQMYEDLTVERRTTTVRDLLVS